MSRLERVGLIGYGYWGSKLARCFYQLGVLVFISDKDQKRREEAAKLYPDVALYEDYQTLVFPPAVDAVAIATPPETHYDIAKFALEHDTGVFVEKPLTTRVNDATELEALAEVKGRPLMVGHIYLHCPGIQVIPRPVGRAELYVSLLNPEGPPSESTRDIRWASLPHAASLALHFFREKPTRIVTKSLGCRVRAQLIYWNGSQAWLDVGDYTGYRRRDVQLIIGNIIYTFTADDPHRVGLGPLMPQGIQKGPEPLMLECKAFLTWEGVDPLGANVVDLVERIIRAGES